MNDKLAHSYSMLRPQRPDAHKVLVALSGGADSSAALLVALRAGVEVHALHVHHGLRESAGQDADHCIALCERFGVPLKLVRLQPQELRDAANVQAAARSARQRALREYIETRGGTDDWVVVTGHHIEDVLESMWMRIGRGCGLTSFVGPQPHETLDGVTYRRPLLLWWRDEIESFVAAQGVRWVDDPTNATDAYHRNRVRRQLVPLLAELPSRASTERSVANLLEEAALWRKELFRRLQTLGFTASVAREGRWLTSRTSLLQAGELAPLLIREAAQGLGGGHFAAGRLRDLPRLLALSEAKRIHGHRLVLDIVGDDVELRRSDNPRAEPPLLRSASVGAPTTLLRTRAHEALAVDIAAKGFRLCITQRGGQSADAPPDGDLRRSLSFFAPAASLLRVVRSVEDLEIISPHSGRRKRASEQMRSDGWPQDARRRAVAIFCDDEAIALVCELGIRRVGTRKVESGLEYRVVVP